MSPNPIHTGDDGSTGVLGKDRLPKYHLQIETLGSLDEASAALGLARALTRVEGSAAILVEVQRDLYAMMAEVAATPETSGRIPGLDSARLDWLEIQVSSLEAGTTLPSEFILPGDSLPGAAFSLARTIIRRAERRVAELYARRKGTCAVILPYLNRLSTLCFFLELKENQAAGKRTSLAKE